MRPLAALSLITCLALVPIATASAEADVAVRVEGYLGYANLDAGSVDLDAFQGGGTGSASMVFGQIYLQGDVFGDVMDFEEGIDVKNVGPGVHLGWRDSEIGSAGIVGAYNDLDVDGISVDVFRTGFEGEAYFDKLTLGLNVGYLDFDHDANAYIEGLFAFYATESARLDFRIGAVGVGEDGPVVNLGLGGELLVNDIAAPFVRWEASISDGFGNVIQHSLVAGVTIYWGADTPTLQSYDRNHFQRGCAGLLLIGRTC